MPRTRHPPSLYFVTLKSCLPVLKNLEKKYRDGNTAVAPLDRLPGSIVSDLMEMLCLDYYCSSKSDSKSKDFENPQNLRILFTHRVTRVMVFHCDKDYSHLTSRCKNMKDVTLLGVKMPDFTRMSFIFQRRSTVVLRAFGSGRGNDILFRNSELRNSFVPQRDMEDVNWMWRFPCCSPVQNTKSPVLLRPTELYLSDVYMAAGTLALILESLPRIRILRNEKLLEALYRMHSKDEGDQVVPYELLNIDMEFSSEDFEDNFDKSSTAADLGVRLCPKARMVFLALGLDTPQTVFLLLANLKLVEELVVMSSVGEFFPNEPLYTFLSTHGKDIKRLQLRDMVLLDPERVVSLCPKLEHLNLVGTTLQFGINPDIQFKLLENLSVVHINPADGVPFHLWQYLLKSPKLGRINLKKANLDSGLLDDIVTLNLWKGVSVVWMNECTGFKPYHVFDLLLEDNCLCDLRLIQCKGLNQQQTESFANCIYNKSLDVRYELIPSIQ